MIEVYLSNIKIKKINFLDRLCPFFAGDMVILSDFSHI